jgi:hypothetical protein
MSSIRDMDGLISGQELPLELRHQSSAHHGEETRVASRVSGLVAARHQDDVICPYLVRRNLLIPSDFAPPPAMVRAGI